MQDRRLIYALSAVAALLTLGIIVLVILLVGSGDDDDDGADVASEQTETSTPAGTETEEASEDDDETPEEETPTSTPRPPADTAIEAVGRFIENQGEEFAGDCTTTDIEEDAGKFCAVERGTSGNQIAFAVGPTFSEFTDLFFVRPEGDGFVVDHIEPAPCGGELPCPPPIGAVVEIVTDEGCVNARSEPSISASINECVDNGTEAELVAGPTEADARTWVELEGFGWVSASFISCRENCG